VFEEIPDDLALETDERKLSQILRNLVSNALKFTDSGEVRVSVNREGSELVFSVKDTGIGIAPEDQERIFREFAQVDGPVQRKVKGTGLGLPLSRKLAELLGGSLDVQSELGKGSTFWLRLPLPKTESVVPAAAGTRHAKSHETDERDRHDSVLIIDDDEVARYLIRQQLRGTNYYIGEASGGIEGLERARFDQPRLIILDIGMPDRSGFEIMDELKADPATRNIPIVIHTSRTLSSDEMVRLGGKQAAILPKGPGNTAHAWDFIRSVLGKPQLSAAEEEESVSRG
jgi:CheY-like chemotaxis protein